MATKSDHPKGSYGVTRKMERTADGVNHLKGLVSTCPVNICQKCERVVDQLYPSGATRICGACKARIEYGGCCGSA